MGAMANQEQRLVLLRVADPGQPADITPRLEKLDFWGEGWTIQGVSVSPTADNSRTVVVAVVLTREIPTSFGASAIA
jgi:hypothetical protein